MNIKLVIFDCDGTLVDSEALGNQAFAEVLTKHGYSITPAEATQLFRGMKLAICLEQIENEAAITFPSDFESQFRSRMAELFKAELKPIAGANSLLASMRINYCIASSGPKKKIENSLRLAKLDEHFTNNIFSSYDVGIWKPDPGFFLHISNHYQVDPEECIVVEDSLPGLTAGCAGKMNVFAYAPNGIDSEWPKGITAFSSLEGIQNRFIEFGIAS